MANKLWTKDELIVAFNLYLKLPFGKMHSRNPEIIHLASVMGRTANSIALRLVNFASVDPYHQNRGVVGMKGGAKQVQPIWDEFFQNREALIFESERILADKENQTIENKYKELFTDIANLKGETRLREVKTRVNQSFFRKLIMVSYDYTCCITGIKQPDLLIASHIRPWGIDVENRLNPCNGLALNALHDKAFDNGLITITTDYHIKISSILLKQKQHNEVNEYFARYDNKKINLPQKYNPDVEFLKYHNQERFKP